MASIEVKSGPTYVKQSAESFLLLLRQLKEKLKRLLNLEGFQWIKLPLTYPIIECQWNQYNKRKYFLFVVLQNGCQLCFLPVHASVNGTFFASRIEVVI